MRRKIGKWVIGFFCMMICCTLAARGASGALVARVGTAQIRKGVLENRIAGDGSVQVGEISYQFLPEGQKVNRLLVTEGESVEEGQEIMLMDESYLQGLIDQEAAELEKLNLQLQQQELQGKAEARTPETASAQISLDAAQDALNQAQAAYNQAVAEAETFAASPPGPEALEDEIAQWNQRMDELNAQINSAYDLLENQNSAYNQAARQYNLAQQNEENIRKNQEAAQQANQLACDSIRVDMENVQKKIEKLENIKETGCVIKAQASGIFLTGGAAAGAVTTGSELVQIAVGPLQAMGTIAAEDVGLIQVGDEVQVKFAGTSQSVPLQITHLGSGNLLGGQNSSGGTAADGTASGESGASAVWYADLTGTDAGLGTAFSYEAVKSSESYQQTIPLNALRESQGKTYILSVQERDGILGKEYTAVSVPVTVLEKDEDTAAVTCTLEDTVPVIVSSNKYVEEGDPVRLQE